MIEFPDDKKYQDALNDVYADMMNFSRYLIENKRFAEAETCFLLAKRFKSGTSYGYYEYFNACQALSQWFGYDNISLERYAPITWHKKIKNFFIRLTQWT